MKNEQQNNIIFDQHLYSLPGGLAASAWYDYFCHDYLLPDEVPLLPSKALAREDVFRYCSEKHQSGQFIYSELFCYTLIMAWGLQGINTGWKNAREPVAKEEYRKTIIDIGQRLRAGSSKRADSFNFFSKNEKIHHLSVSYFSKFMFFMSANRDHYILDFWMAKSINVFKKEKIIPVWAAKKNNKTISSGLDTKKITGTHYQRYCEIIDKFAKDKRITGSQAEAAIFDARRPWEKKGVWRQQVEETWEQFAEIKHRKDKGRKEQ